MKAKQYPEGILGRKIGMTQIFSAEGENIPVTVIEAGPCVVLELKNDSARGYSAAQLGFMPKKAKSVNKPMAGHFARAGKGAFSHVEELRCDTTALGWELGKEVSVADLFQAGEFVDVSGVTLGRGMSGVVRRFKVKGQPETRGTHEYRRHIGAIGCRKFPGRVHKNKRMPGRMGTDNVTIQNLKVIEVKPEQNLILVRGGIPGVKGGVVVIRKAMKSFLGTKAKAAQAA